MAYYQVHKDWATGESTGAGRTFQVISLEDENGEDCVKSLSIDQGIHFHSDDELKEYIAEKRKANGMPDEPIELEEV